MGTNDPSSASARFTLQTSLYPKVTAQTLGTGRFLAALTIARALSGDIVVFLTRDICHTL